MIRTPPRTEISVSVRYLCRVMFDKMCVRSSHALFSSYLIGQCLSNMVCSLI